MEDQTFKLDKAIAAWRNELQSEGIDPETIEELEGHLVESCESLQASGLSEREAFSTAADRLGKPDDLNSKPPAVESAEPRRRSGCMRALGIWIMVGGILLVVCMIGLITAFFMRPNVYSPRATVQLFHTEENQLSFSSFQQTQFAIIKSRKILEGVVADLDLAKRWDLSEESSYKKLDGALRLQGVRGTDLIEIRVSDTDLELAALLANTIAQGYQEKLGIRDNSWPRVAIHELAVPASTPSNWIPTVSLISIVAVLGALLILAGVTICRCAR